MLKQILDLIEKHDSIVIYGHLNPDGDCYGAQVGLRDIINKLYPNKKVYITGSGWPKFFKLICPMDKVSDETIENSLAILVDGNDLARMEDKRIYNAKAWAKIDHHIDTNSFTEGPQIVDVSANSTCDILTGIAMKLGVDVSIKGATALYLGIVTDSSKFQFVNNYNETFERAKYLSEHGANIETINSLLAKTDEKSLKAKGYIMTHYKKSKGGVIYIIYQKEKLHKLRLSANAVSNLVNLLGNIEGHPIWCSFAEYEDGRVRCEFRSNGPEVQPVAHSIGGGGHAHASGAGLEKLDYDLIYKVIDDLDDVLAKWKENK